MVCPPWPLSSKLPVYLTQCAVAIRALGWRLRLEPGADQLLRQHDAARHIVRHCWTVAATEVCRIDRLMLTRMRGRGMQFGRAAILQHSVTPLFRGRGRFEAPGEVLMPLSRRTQTAAFRSPTLKNRLSFFEKRPDSFLVILAVVNSAAH